MKAPAVKCIVKAPRERGVSRIGRSRGVEEEDINEREYAGKRGIDAGFRPREGPTNGVANEYRVWIRREPIGVRDVLPRSREKRQSGVLTVGVALGERDEVQGMKGKRG